MPAVPPYVMVMLAHLYRLAAAASLVTFYGLTASPAQAQRTLSEVEAVFATRQTALYDQAAEDFLGRLQLGADDRTVAHLAIVMPDSLLSQRGEALATWWRSQDPLPGTPRNERLVEYLARLATAQRVFGNDSALGFDERGETFVRYGNPAERRSIDVDSNLFISRAIRNSAFVRRSEFPANSVWYYPNLGRDVYFVFVQSRGKYRLGGVMDLIPPSLLAGGTTRVTEPRALLLGQVLRWLYKDLYTFSAEFRDRLVDIDAAVDSEGRAFSGRTGLLLQSEVQKAQQSDELDQRVRDETVPRSQTQVQPPGFGVVSQSARFYDAPGDSLAVWFGWSLDPTRTSLVTDSLTSVGLTPTQYLVDATVVSYDSGYRSVGRQSVRRPISSSRRPSWLSASVPSPQGSVAAQWTLVAATASGDVSPPGAVAAHVKRSGAPDTPLGHMSDLMAVDAREAFQIEEVDRLDAFPPPPRDLKVFPGQPIAVYFEVYGERDDRYEVETRVVLVRDGRLLRRGTEQGGGSASEITLYDWRYPVVARIDTTSAEASDRLRIEVTTTQLESGVAVTRVLELDVL